MTAQAAEKKTVKSKKEKALVIVESPAKSKTIKKILGDGYQIEASFGHVRNLPDNVLGFDVNNDFKPTYVVIPEKKKVVTKLNDLAKRSDKIYLASDPDREGEAIAWHVRELLQVPDDKVFRIEFNEITPKAVKYAVEHSRQIDMDRVKAQQTRQILDKLVGYKLSPVLWKQLGNYRLSAGRVQSVALRMICEREEEIEAFIPQEYWSIHTIMDKDGKLFEAEVNKYKNKKIEIKNEEEANKIKEFLLNPETEFVVDKVTKKETKRKPTAPFITSTLQRAASSKLGFGVSKTMQVAQKLYEGIEIDGTPVGLITYMRTDSVRISDDAHEMAKSFILQNYGEKYYPATTNVYVKGKQNVQDAHEAIRPSYPERTPESIKQYLQPDQYKLYKLIWDKFMSSQMAPAEIANKTIDIKAGDYNLKAGTSKILFDGFLKLYNDAEEDEKDADAKIPDLEQGDKVKCKEITPKQHFTQPPPRYNEASLVKALEEHGIGRPSTYATIITVIQTRKYVEKRDKALVPTLLGRTVCKQLVNQFANIMDYKFTAGMEEKLDKIAEKKAVWNVVLKEFYTPFMEVVNSVMKTAQKVVIESDKKCPNCGKVMLVKTSRFGTQFLGCSGYPECKTIISLNNSVELDDVEGEGKEQQTVDEKCEKCGSEMVMKVGPYGKYLECKECKNRKKYIRSTGVKCPKCGEGTIIEKKSKYGKIFFGCNRYPECSYALWDEPTGNKCPECGELLVKKVTKNGNFEVCSSRTCSFKHPLEDVKESEKPE
ncbi:TPA: DNA topoisomerase I [Candidatus Gastranaerophilales bacterium HUM_13]|nr:MAG TPA: DNA topoisomerase I [Candidatus Gastranaerophilales bacterium HUM_8]DAB02189.1 MAG TPA: DNA topoisomerase I [Candidatus Gastranaerophilales bacterium HUM_10]DAB09238.1 MAG TPA: DNA topoisomerase I [Candidatus Gastranaerophilales bacterium HUM_13]